MSRTCDDDEDDDGDSNDDDVDDDGVFDGADDTGGSVMSGSGRTIDLTSSVASFERNRGKFSPINVLPVPCACGATRRRIFPPRGALQFLSDVLTIAQVSSDLFTG